MFAKMPGITNCQIMTTHNMNKQFIRKDFSLDSAMSEPIFLTNKKKMGYVKVNDFFLFFNEQVERKRIPVSYLNLTLAR